MKKRIAIIGGGAAGMMVAATLVENNSDAEIHLFEKNKELGTKVRISGGGRCNVTTGFYKKQDLQKKYTRGREFIAHAMGQFGPRKMYARCETHGVPLKCEDDMRVFPQSNNSHDIAGIFEKLLKSGGVTIHFQEGILSVEKIERPVAYTVTTEKGVSMFDFVVITTGGNAYSHTGSTGEGYDLARSLGHTITKLGPSLNSFLVQEQWIKECTGISFPNAKLHRPVSYNSQVDKNGMRPVAVSGPILLTHFGISGPLTFTYSSQIPYFPISTQEPHIVNLVPFSDRNEQVWLKILDEKANNEPKKQLSTILGYDFTKRRVELFLQEFKIDGTIMISNVSREQRKKIAKLLGNGFPITLIARRPGDEFVTAGGINTDEVDPKTMESKLSPGIYFAGEVLNIDAVTGGFNFQSCWATGRCAGMNIR